jgi:hypothetical protein
MGYTKCTEKDSWEEERPRGLTRNSPLPRLYKILYRTIWKTPNAEIPKMNFSLLSNPLVLFNRIFRAWLSFFRRTILIRLTI